MSMALRLIAVADFQRHLQDITIAANNVTITSTSPSYTIPNHVRIQPITLEDNATITLPAYILSNGERRELVVELTQNDVGNNSVTFVAPNGFTLTYNGTGSIAPGINLVANKRTHFVFRYSHGSSVIDGSLFWFEG